MPDALSQLLLNAELPPYVETLCDIIFTIPYYFSLIGLLAEHRRYHALLRTHLSYSSHTHSPAASRHDSSNARSVCFITVTV
jgi:hypothetical protein